jgi:hypothetical protein
MKLVCTLFQGYAGLTAGFKTGFSLVLELGRELGLAALMTLTGARAAMPGARFLDFVSL